ncbi:MAG: hypothetical protein GF317_08320 [Candidatus Lokiarchaeota archaeon]|nr:hypothetical protein [Candidatus Lokiarchaeota archaeon]MBD3199716.1 hypothetical protein [Candidatus Lokiarchaeota archaeon]
MELSISVRYLNISNFELHEYQIFHKHQEFGKVSPFSIINATFCGRDEHFNCIYLDRVYENLGVIRTINFFINISIAYKIFFNTIPVAINFRNINLNTIECPTCQL